MINTPWELYEIDSLPVWVKREDLCSAPPAPPFSKIRGLHTYLTKVKKRQGEDVWIGVMDTQHSMAGWGAAYVCKELGLRCIDYYPVLKADTGLRPFQIKALELGAHLHPMKAGMSAVLFNQAKKVLLDTHENSLMLPNGLKLWETVNATAEEVLTTPKVLTKPGTWVVSISSGTIAAGVVKGLNHLNFVGEVVLHMGYSRSYNETHHYVQEMSGYSGGYLKIIDENYAYKDKVDNSWIPFPCNPWYDAKAFTWLCQHIKTLRQPVVFWNIGA